MLLKRPRAGVSELHLVLGCGENYCFRAVQVKGIPTKFSQNPLRAEQMPKKARSMSRSVGNRDVSAFGSGFLVSWPRVQTLMSF